MGIETKASCLPCQCFDLISWWKFYLSSKALRICQYSSCHWEFSPLARRQFKNQTISSAYLHLPPLKEHLTVYIARNVFIFLSFSPTTYFKFNFEIFYFLCSSRHKWKWSINHWKSREEGILWASFFIQFMKTANKEKINKNTKNFQRGPASHYISCFPIAVRLILLHVNNKIFYHKDSFYCCLSPFNSDAASAAVFYIFLRHCSDYINEGFLVFSLQLANDIDKGKLSGWGAGENWQSHFWRLNGKIIPSPWTYHSSFSFPPHHSQTQPTDDDDDDDDLWQLCLSTTNAPPVSAEPYFFHHSASNTVEMKSSGWRKN